MTKRPALSVARLIQRGAHKARRDGHKRPQSQKLEPPQPSTKLIYLVQIQEICLLMPIIHLVPSASSLVEMPAFLAGAGSKGGRYIERLLRIVVPGIQVYLMLIICFVRSPAMARVPYASNAFASIASQSVLSSSVPGLKLKCSRIESVSSRS